MCNDAVCRANIGKGGIVRQHNGCTTKRARCACIAHLERATRQIHAIDKSIVTGQGQNTCTNFCEPPSTRDNA